MRSLSHFFKGEASLSKWISVEDALPRNTGEYLCFVKVHGVRIRRFSIYCNGTRSNWWSNGTATKKVTHWMPLPDAPGVA